MKKLILSALIFAGIFLNAQEKYDIYSLDYWPDKKEFKIEVSGKKDIEKVWIEAYSLDRTSKEGYINIEAKKVPTFVSFLEFSKTKFAEWSKTAQENNVQELNKIIEPEKRFSCSAAFSYGKWQFDYSVTLTSRFLLDSKGSSLIIGTGELQSSSNQFMKSDGLALVFTSMEEIESFIQKMEISKMNDVLMNKEKKQDLFK